MDVYSERERIELELVDKHYEPHRGKITGWCLRAGTNRLALCLTAGCR